MNPKQEMNFTELQQVVQRAIATGSVFKMAIVYTDIQRYEIATYKQGRQATQAVITGLASLPLAMELFGLQEADLRWTTADAFIDQVTDFYEANGMGAMKEEILDSLQVLLYD